jgi:hypothetical protein
MSNGTFVTSEAGVFHVLNDEHEELCQEAAEGSTHLEYREWDIIVWPDTPHVGRDGKQQASARAIPIDRSKLPADRPNASLSGNRMVITNDGDPKIRREYLMRQVITGLNRVAANIDAIEDGNV